MGKLGSWIFTQTSPADESLAETVKFRWEIPGTYEEKASGKGKTVVSGTYPKDGVFTAKLSIDGGDTITCSEITVRKPKLLGCECNQKSVNTYDDKTEVVWALENCVGENDAGLSKVFWSENVTSNGWTEAKAQVAPGDSLTPEVRAQNGAGYEVTVTCEQYKSE